MIKIILQSVLIIWRSSLLSSATESCLPGWQKPAIAHNLQEMHAVILWKVLFAHKYIFELEISLHFHCFTFSLLSHFLCVWLFSLGSLNTLQGPLLSFGIQYFSSLGILPNRRAHTCTHTWKYMRQGTHV